MRSRCAESGVRQRGRHTRDARRGGRFAQGGSERSGVRWDAKQRHGGDGMALFPFGPAGLHAGRPMTQRRERHGGRLRRALRSMDCCLRLLRDVFVCSSQLLLSCSCRSHQNLFELRLLGKARIERHPATHLTLLSSQAVSQHYRQVSLFTSRHSQTLIREQRNVLTPGASRTLVHKPFANGC